MSDLRDHSQPCDHPTYRYEVEAEGKGWLCERPGCPGGRLVIIDYEAAAKAWVGLAGRQGWTYEDEVQILVDAALGIGDTE